MKTSLALTIAALAALATPARAQETPPPPLAPPLAPTPPAPSVPNNQHKAVITVFENGRQETREIDLDNPGIVSLGKNHEIKILTDGDKAAPHREKSVYMGVTPDAVPEEVRAQLSLEPGSGIILRGVSANGPAAKAGLQRNDVLTKFDDQRLLSEHQFRLLIKAKHDGDVAHVAYLRRGQPGTADVTLGTQDSFDWSMDPGSFQGSFDNDGSVNGEELSKNVNAVVRHAMKTAMNSLNQSKAIVTDKAGQMVRLLNDDMVEVNTTLDTVDKAMRRAGIDEKTIADTKRQIADELKRNEDGLQKAQDGLKKATDGLKKAAAAQGKTAGTDSDDDDND